MKRPVFYGEVTSEVTIDWCHLYRDITMTNQLVATSLAGWWLGRPSEKYEFVNWDDDIPNSHGKIKLMFQTTNQLGFPFWGSPRVLQPGFALHHVIWNGTVPGIRLRQSLGKSLNKMAWKSSKSMGVLMDPPKSIKVLHTSLREKASNYNIGRILHCHVWRLEGSNPSIHIHPPTTNCGCGTVL